MHILKKGHVNTQQEGGCLQAERGLTLESKAASTASWTAEPLELCETNICCLSHLVFSILFSSLSCLRQTLRPFIETS